MGCSLLSSVSNKRILLLQDIQVVVVTSARQREPLEEVHMAVTPMAPEQGLEHMKGTHRHILNTQHMGHPVAEIPTVGHRTVEILTIHMEPRNPMDECHQRVVFREERPHRQDTELTIDTEHHPQLRVTELNTGDPLLVDPLPRNEAGEVFKGRRQS